MNRARPKQIVIRVSEKELEAIKKKVEQSGKSQQQYIIESLMQKKIVNMDGVKQLIPEIRRIGNNLNQIAKHMNEGKYPTIPEVINNQEELNQIWRLLKQYLQKRV